MSILILGISTIIQFIAAILSVRLIQVTGRKGAWIFIAIAMTLMGIRRSVTLYRSITNDTTYSADLSAELVALTISILMVIGVMLIGPIFKKYQSINETLQLSEKKYKDMVNLLPQPIYETNVQGNVTFANQAGYKSFDTNFDDIYGKIHILDFIIPEDRERAKKNIQRITQGETVEPNEYTMLRKNGSTFPALVYSIPIIITDKVSGIRCLVIDLTERKQAEESVARYSRIFEDSLNEIYLFDSNTLKFVQLNNATLHNLGYTLEEMKELTPVDLKPNFTLELFEKLLVPLRKGEKEIVVFETVHKRKDGSLYDAEVHLQLQIQDNKELFSAYVLDITERKQAGKMLSYQASHDALTGLPNRRDFERRVDRILSTVQLDKSEHALCFMDLDQFKLVNDTCGHIAGDALLRQIGQVLQDAVRKRDTLARLGGDEFGILLEHCSLDKAEKIANTLQQHIQDFQFCWEEQTFRGGMSIGLVAINETTPSLTELMKQADAACYMAKDLGRNRIHIYHLEDTEIAERHGEMQWVNRISQALDENRFCLYAQAIVPLDDSNEKHYELLLRMLDKEGKVISPGAFLPAAERYGLVEKLDAWVIENAIALLAAHREFLKEIHFISINLSGPSLTNGAFLNSIITQLKESGRIWN